jgi:2'-5' RNA ligase superfamily protein
MVRLFNTVAQTERPLETVITLVLEDADEALAEAHRELYPERIAEHIPFSLTLLYPWIPREAVTQADVEALRAFFATRRPLAFDLARVAEFPGLVAYAVPEPDDELRATMRALWALYPEYPPYGRPGTDPPPHATLGRLEGEYAITSDQARERVEPLLPVRCDVREATLMEEYEPDRMRVLESVAFGGPLRR